MSIGIGPSIFLQQLGVSLLAADTVTAAGGAGGALATATSAGRWPRGVSGREAVVDLVAGHLVTCVGLKQSAIEKVSTPANWPFDNMLTRTRARAMKRMTDRSITDSARKRRARCELCWLTINNVETYVSIVRDMIPVAPASQDVLDVCLTQASLEAKKKR